MLIEKNLNLQSHIELVENKISKNNRVLFIVGLHLNKKCISMVDFSFTLLDINYGNIGWTSISHTKLENIIAKQGVSSSSYIS